jgi:hypothetical protein
MEKKLYARPEIEVLSMAIYGICQDPGATSGPINPNNPAFKAKGFHEEANWFDVNESLSEKKSLWDD